MSPEDKPSETSPPSHAVRKWLTGWTVTVVVVPVLLIVAGLAITNYWNRPQLSVSVTKAIVGSHRVVDPAGVHEYRAIVDLRTPCVAWLAENHAATERIMPAAVAPVVPRLVYGVYLQNTGRSELTDIRIAFRAKHVHFTVSASPQLSLTLSDDIAPGGEKIRTVTIASLAPKARGVILGSLAVDGGSVRVESKSQDQFRVWYDLGETDYAPSSLAHILFAGSRQMNDVDFGTISVNDFFGQQKALFGMEAVKLPLDPIEISAEGGEAGLRIIRAPYQGCPTTAPEGSYILSIHQRGTEAASAAAQASVIP